jgi:putative thioredoxin
MTDSKYVVNVTTQDFQTKVIDNSMQVPVLVDFWAEWCAPCQSLMPTLLALAEAYNGQFILAKINIDEQPQLAQHFAVRSVPTLKLFRHGQAVEEVMGAQPESVLRALIDKYRERPSDKIRLRAASAINSGDYAQAIELLTQAIGIDPDYHELYFDLINALMESKQWTQAEQLFAQLPINIQTQAEAQILQAKLYLAQQLDNNTNLSELRQKLSQQPEQLGILQQLAYAEAVEGEYEAAMENFLTIMKRERSSGTDKGQKGLLAIFQILGTQHPLVKRYRSKMSALLY